LKKFLFAIVCVFSLTIFLVGCGGESEKKQFLSIATGGTAGTYYPIGAVIAEIINKEIPSVNAGAESTGATVANINMLKENSVDLAIVQNDIVFYAANGTEMFEDNKVENLRGIISLYPETCQFVTLENLGIKSISDLRGKRVAVGAAGSGVEANVRQILAAYGLSFNDIDAKYLSFAESANALRDGNVDAACLTAGYPTASVHEISKQQRIRLLPISSEKADELIQKYPFYTKTVIPAGTYAEFNEDTESLAVMAMLICTDRLSDDLGQKITEAIFKNTDKLKAAHTVGKYITEENATKGMSIPMNKGAEDYFKK